MKKIISIVILTVVLTLSVAVVGSTVISIQNDLISEEFRIESEIISAALADKPNNAKKIIDIMEFATENLVNSEDMNYILQLINEGYDINEVKSSILFWIDTDEDIRLVKNLLDNMMKNPDINVEYRLENAYDKITDKKNGVLTFEEGKEYLEAGLTLEDLHIANQLSRKGISTIHEILDSKKETGSMNKEIKKIFSKTKREKYDFDNISDDDLSGISESEFISCIELSRVKNRKVKNIMSNKKSGFIEELQIEKENMTKKVKADIELAIKKGGVKK